MRTDQRILEIRAGRRWPLVDEPVGLVVAGARPGSEVAVRATVEGAGAVHQARATFDADQAGVVDTARQASRAGSYTGVDPFGLWWSGQPVGPSRRPPSAPLTARVQAATAGRMAEAVLERHWLTLGAAATPVRERGCWGAVRPAGRGRPVPRRGLLRRLQRRPGRGGRVGAGAGLPRVRDPGHRLLRRPRHPGTHRGPPPGRRRLVCPWGMPAANAAARADSWPRVLAFLAAAGS
jgi:Acyl-CoA thioester hydrolase/BAAT N-terminal region